MGNMMQMGRNLAIIGMIPFRAVTLRWQCIKLEWLFDLGYPQWSQHFSVWQRHKNMTEDVDGCGE